MMWWSRFLLTAEVSTAADAPVAATLAATLAATVAGSVAGSVALVHSSSHLIS